MGKVLYNEVIIVEKDDRNIIKDWLRSHKYAVLATSYQDNPWAATVDYTSDDELNLYFETSEDTLKYKNLSKNPNVCIVIDSQTDEGTLQVQGVAKTTTKKGKNNWRVVVEPKFMVYRRLDNKGRVRMVMLHF